jgi:hypothetical protein
MHTNKQVRDMLDVLVEQSDNDEARALRRFVPINDPIEWRARCKQPFVVPTFYARVCAHVDEVLAQFRAMPQGLTMRHFGLTIRQIAEVMGGMGEDWPDYVIANALQLRMLAKDNRLYSAEDVSRMRFDR